jgi:predicted nucleotidyltransferase
METTKNKLPENVKKFFYELSDYLDTKFYYFGSVQRSDYIPGKSDIDIDVFPENEYSLMNKLQHYLHVAKSDFRKVAWIINDIPIYGYKLKYVNERENINAEFSIYNDQFKDIIVNEHNRKNEVPIYVTIMLYIIKFLYYQIPLLDKKTFAYLKRVILNGTVGEEIDAKFLVLEYK